MEIKCYQHGEGDFWCRMGEFFASAKVRGELDAYMVSDPTFTWWLALDGDHVLGFAAARRQKNGVVRLCYGYVVAERRNEGIYEQLFAARQADVLTWPDVVRLVSTVGEISGKPFYRAGFKKVGTNGSYAVVELEVSHA